MEDSNLLELFLLMFPDICLLLEACALLQRLLGSLLVIPEIGLGNGSVTLFYFFLDGSEVKDNLEGSPCVVRGPGCDS
jgi:hypothetical protein